MKIIVTLAMSMIAAAAPAAADPPRDQQQAWNDRRNGRLLPLRSIEQRVLPTMRGSQYLGFDFEGSSGIYTLKFLRDGMVIWVEVDGQSGQIIGRSRN